MERKTRVHLGESTVRLRLLGGPARRCGASRRLLGVVVAGRAGLASPTEECGVRDEGDHAELGITYSGRGTMPRGTPFLALGFVGACSITLASVCIVVDTPGGRAETEVFAMGLDCFAGGLATPALRLAPRDRDGRTGAPPASYPPSSLDPCSNALFSGLMPATGDASSEPPSLSLEPSASLRVLCTNGEYPCP